MENARDQNTVQLSKSQPCWETSVWAGQEMGCKRSCPASLSSAESVAALSCSLQGPNPKEHPRNRSSHPVTPQVTSKLPNSALVEAGHQVLQPHLPVPHLARDHPNPAGAAEAPAASAAPSARGRMQLPGSPAARRKAGSSILLPDCAPHWGTSQIRPQEGDTEGDRVLRWSQREPTHYPNTAHPKAGSSCAPHRGLSPQSEQ